MNLECLESYRLIWGVGFSLRWGPPQDLRKVVTWSNLCRKSVPLVTSLR